MLQALRSVMLPAGFEAGFVHCQLYIDSVEPDSLCYQEDWSTQADLERQIRSTRFGRLLSVIETSSGLPTLEVRLISETRGWNYIRLIRGESEGLADDGEVG
jgi:hypothetical protein